MRLSMAVIHPPDKHIPVGTRVRWQTVAGSGPMHEGMVETFHPVFGYTVMVDRTPSGKIKPHPVRMRTSRARLEVGNQNLLK
jgi:hypothetical protein